MISEEKLYDYFESSCPDILDKLKSSFDDDVIKALKENLEKFIGVYST